jgi:2-iminobutanoate/2-iminopropanoate deaminase
MPDAFNIPSIRRPFGIFSHAAWAGKGELLFLSGQVAESADIPCVGIGNVKAQTRQILDNLKAVMEYAGGTLDDIVMVKVYVTDMRHLDAIHEVRREYFNEPYPASTLVQVVSLVSPDYLLEIDAVAVVNRTS